MNFCCYLGAKRSNLSFPLTSLDPLLNKEDPKKDSATHPASFHSPWIWGQSWMLISNDLLPSHTVKHSDWAGLGLESELSQRRSLSRGSALPLLCEHNGVLHHLCGSEGHPPSLSSPVPRPWQHQELQSSLEGCSSGWRCRSLTAAAHCGCGQPHQHVVLSSVPEALTGPPALCWESTFQRLAI